MRRGFHEKRWYPRILLVGAFVLTVAMGTLEAQEMRSITLREAIQVALENNIELQLSSNRVAASQLHVQQAKADFYPDLSASASASRGYRRGVDGIADQTEGMDSQAFNLRLSSGESVTLFSGFGKVASLDRSKVDLATTQKSQSRTRQSVVFQTISRYLGVVLDKELILSEQENLKAQRQQLARIEEFYKAGNRPVADVLQQKASIAQAELRLLAAERSYDVGKLELLRTMGLEATVDYEVAGLPIEQMASDLVSRPPDQLVVSESAKRPDFQAQELRIDAASEQVRAARSGYWPALSLSASAGSDYASRSHAGGFSDQFFDSNPNAQIGVSLSIPLFDRYETKHNVAQAQVQLANERLDLEDLKQQISFEVQQAVLDYQTATKELDVAEAQLGFARQALEAAEGRYNVGASTLVELAQSRAQYVAAVNGRVKARYSLLLGRVAVDYYQGDLNRMLALFE